MVDSNLIEEIKEIREKGVRKPSDGLKICEFVKQMVEKSKDFRTYEVLNKLYIFVKLYIY